MSEKLVTYYDAMAEVWYAYVESGQPATEEVPYGYGLTEGEAIKDLREMLSVQD